MGTIIKLLLPLALKVLARFFKHKEESDAAKAFLLMVGSMEIGGSESVKLHESFRDQVEAIKKRKEAKLEFDGEKTLVKSSKILTPEDLERVREMMNNERS